MHGMAVGTITGNLGINKAISKDKRKKYYKTYA